MTLPPPPAYATWSTIPTTYFRYGYEWWCLEFPTNEKNFCISIAKCQIHLPFHIIDDDKNTHSAIGLIIGI